jgi:hypothetical protein
MFVKSASFIRIICSSDGQSIFDILNVVFFILYRCRLGRPTITANGLGLCEVGAFKAQMFNLAQMFIRITNA